MSRALRVKPQVRPNIVCSRKGKQYTKDGFDSVWQRLVDKAVAEGMERFQFRDLRRKSASDEDDETVARRGWDMPVRLSTTVSTESNRIELSRFVSRPLRHPAVAQPLFSRSANRDRETTQLVRAE